jgi:hypothetical protein
MADTNDKKIEKVEPPKPTVPLHPAQFKTLLVPDTTVSESWEHQGRWWS